MSHHIPIIHKGIKYGHIRITNDSEILSIWIYQPWGSGELFVPEDGLREEE